MKNKVELELVNLDGNSYFLLGAFSRAAKQQGWTKAETDEVLADCQSSDYDHLLATLIEHTVEPDESGEDDLV